jgi:hypothetical protein
MREPYSYKICCHSDFLPKRKAKEKKGDSAMQRPDKYYFKSCD